MNSKFIWTVLIVAAVLAIAIWAIDFDTSGEAELPEIHADVDVEKGELPDVTMDTADIEVRERRGEVTYPDVDVDVEAQEKTFTYPEVEVSPPEEQGERE